MNIQTQNNIEFFKEILHSFYCRDWNSYHSISKEDHLETIFYKDKYFIEIGLIKNNCIFIDIGDFSGIIVYEDDTLDFWKIPGYFIRVDLINKSIVVEKDKQLREVVEEYSDYSYSSIIILIEKYLERIKNTS